MGGFLVEVIEGLILLHGEIVNGEWFMENGRRSVKWLMENGEWELKNLPRAVREGKGGSNGFLS